MRRKTRATAVCRNARASGCRSYTINPRSAELSAFFMSSAYYQNVILQNNFVYSLSSFLGLAVALQAVAQGMQQQRHRLVAEGVVLALEFGGKPTCTLAR